MPNVVKVLKEEITRIARKEVKAALAQVRKPTARTKKTAVDLKKRVALLERVNKELQARLAKVEGAQPPPPAAEAAGRAWISGKGIRSLRKRLGLSQAEFARLVSVSDQAVYIWERKSGMLKLRGKTKAAVFAVRDIGAKEAKKRLAELPVTPKSQAKPKRRKLATRG